MAASPATTDARAPTVIDGRYDILFAQPLPGAGAGLPAFTVTDRENASAALMAVECRPGAPPRGRAIAALSAEPLDSVLSPLAHGPAARPDGKRGYFVVCRAPPGPSLEAPRAWDETEIVQALLRPVAHALEGLRRLRLTHRALRPANLFQAAPGSPVALGCAWAGPPAALQPALFEPPYSAMCIPAGRGEGSIADDVYALGVCILALVLRRVPLAGLDEEAIVRRKLEIGSFAALAGEERLPPLLGDLLRTMLAEDPEHRPPPALLTDLSAARARRVATRPVRRAQRPVDLGRGILWEPRSLAYAMAREPEEAASALRQGVIDRWLRRALGDAVLASRLDEATRSADSPDVPGEAAILVMRAIAVLDPLAPLCWRGIALWPDGLGPALAEAEAGNGEPAKLIEEIIRRDAVARWAGLRRERCDPLALARETRQQREALDLKGPGGGRARLAHALNPLLPCASPLLAAHKVARIEDLLPALEGVAESAEARKSPPVDRPMIAFLAAQAERGFRADLVALTQLRDPAFAPLAQMRLLARIQQITRPGPLPRLAAWLAEGASLSLSLWHHRGRRERLAARLREIAERGELLPMVALLDDAAAREEDRAGSESAQAAIAAIDAELAAIAGGQARRAARARRIGQDLAAAVGLLLSAGVLAGLVGG